MNNFNLNNLNRQDEMKAKIKDYEQRMDNISQDYHRTRNRNKSNRVLYLIITGVALCLIYFFLLRPLF